jgi:hypothetical protein
MAHIPATTCVPNLTEPPMAATGVACVTAHDAYAPANSPFRKVPDAWVRPAARRSTGTLMGHFD